MNNYVDALKFSIASGTVASLAANVLQHVVKVVPKEAFSKCAEVSCPKNLLIGGIPAAIVCPVHRIAIHALDKNAKRPKALNMAIVFSVDVLTGVGSASILALLLKVPIPTALTVSAIATLVAGISPIAIGIFNTLNPDISRNQALLKKMAQNTIEVAELAENAHQNAIDAKKLAERVQSEQVELTKYVDQKIK